MNSHQTAKYCNIVESTIENALGARIAGRQYNHMKQSTAIHVGKHVTLNNHFMMSGVRYISVSGSSRNLMHQNIQ